MSTRNLRKRSYDAKSTHKTGLQRLSTDLYLSRKPNSAESRQQWYQREAYEIMKPTQLERIETELKRRRYEFSKIFFRKVIN